MHTGTYGEMIATFQSVFIRSAEGSSRQVETLQKLQNEFIFTIFYKNLWKNTDINYTALLKQAWYMNQYVPLVSGQRCRH